jgi:hypothetical protein
VALCVECQRMAYLRPDWKLVRVTRTSQSNVNLALRESGFATYQNDSTSLKCCETWLEPENLGSTVLNDLVHASMVWQIVIFVHGILLSGEPEISLVRLTGLKDRKGETNSVEGETEQCKRKRGKLDAIRVQETRGKCRAALLERLGIKSCALLL